MPNDVHPAAQRGPVNAQVKSLTTCRQLGPPVTWILTVSSSMGRMLLRSRWVSSPAGWMRSAADRHNRHDWDSTGGGQDKDLLLAGQLAACAARWAHDPPAVQAAQAAQPLGLAELASSAARRPKPRGPRAAVRTVLCGCCPTPRT